MRGFDALQPFRNPRFSLYFAGQVVSNTGTWFQNLALSLVVLELTGSAQALSAVTIAQFTPLLLLGIPAGRLADRIRPRTILLVTSALSALVGVGLAVVIGMSQVPDLRVVYALVFVLGCINTFDRVAAQAIIFEIVGAATLTRSVSISTIALAAARSIGPGLAGIAFAALGAGWCMVINAGSYVVVFVAIALIRPSRLHPRPRVDRAPGVAPVALLQNRSFVTILVVTIVIALLSLNLMLVITSTVSLTFEGDALQVGAAHALNAVGAIVGGVLAAVPSWVSVRSLILGCAGLGAALLANAASMNLTVFLVLAPLLGLGVGYYHGVLQAAAQASVPPAQLGRAMSFVTLGSYGMAPLGALLMGWVIDASSGPVALLIGGVAAVGCSVFVWSRTRGG
ncbi:transporter [Microbacterium sp. Root61]|uniref:MFS transporter n=1 Tax=Microbacterium sp. Root61 TaxID=1736570 RepID=UPI0006F7E7F3|nr:MFS transporter [Microbacterium sp. Root61]KRA25420.1 transporter [Microbacterium sp. Root61]